MGWGLAAAAGISAVGGIAGNYFGSQAQAGADKDALRYQSRQNRKRIQVLKADANKAGIHPLAALGGAGAAHYSPISSANYGLGDAVGDGLSHLGSAVANSRNRPNEISGLQADALRSEVAKNNAEADLLKAQSRTTLLQARNEMLGATTGAMLNFENYQTSRQSRLNPSLPPPPLGSKSNPFQAKAFYDVGGGRVVEGPHHEYAMDPTEMAYPGILNMSDRARSALDTIRDAGSEVRSRAAAAFKPGTTESSKKSKGECYRDVRGRRWCYSDGKWSRN